MPTITYADAGELVALLESPDEPVTVLAGAFVSVYMPSAVLDAWRWKHALIHALSRAAGWCPTDVRRQQDEGMSHLGDPEDLKLERVLEAVERVRVGAGAQIVQLVADGYPNALHEWLAEGLRRGSIAEVVTPNFDELLEHALAETQSTVEGVISHPHGHVSNPTSLRHLLSRFDQRLPEDEHQRTAQSLSRQVVCLGWAGTDPDLIAALQEGRRQVHFLIAKDKPDVATAQNLEKLAASRPVRVYTGGFERVTACGGPQLDFPPERAYAASRKRISAFIDGLPVEEVRRAYVALSYEYSLGTRHEVDHVSLLKEWHAAGLRGSREHHLWLMSKAEHAQATGRSSYSAFLNLRDYRKSQDPYRISEAGDALERSMRGLNPLKSPLGLATHGATMLLYKRRDEQPPAWARARFARALTRMGQNARAKNVLDAILISESDGLDLWVRAHCYRLRALATAHLPASGWEQDLEVAGNLFEFAGRPLEVGNVWRARAVCEIIAGRADWRVRAMKSLDRAAKQYELATDASAPALLRAQQAITGRLGRRTAAALLTSL